MNYFSRCCKSNKLLKPKLMILCLMSFFTVGCQNNILKYDKNTQQEIYGKLKSAIKFQFDDPESVKFYDVRKIQNDIDDEDEISYCGEFKENVSGGVYSEKKRFIYYEDWETFFIIPNEKPHEEEEDLFYSVMWKGGCKKNNLEFMMSKSLDLRNIYYQLEEAKDERDRLKSSENSPEYLEAEKEYESLKKRADRLKKEITIYN